MLLIKNNNESIFCCERCKDIAKQTISLSFLVKRDTKITNLKVKVKAKKGIPVYKILITNNTDEKEWVELSTSVTI